MHDYPHAFSRRRLLQVGALGGLGLTLPELLRAESQSPAKKTSKIKSCILLFCYGGPSAHETWDPKPNAPAEIRGEFKTIATNVAGIRIGEHLPRMAKVMDKAAIVRSFHHPMRNHNSAAVEALCGRTPLKGDLELLNDDSNSFPCYGSTLSYLTKAKAAAPPFVALPHVMYNVVVLPGQNAGFLGSQYNAVQVVRDPNLADFHLGELELPADLSYSRLENRESLLHLVNQQTDRQAKIVAKQSTDPFYERAFQLIRSEIVRRSFDIAQEAPAMRDRYGRNKLGQSLLLARRQVEAGVRFVSVYDQVHNGLDNWDTHVDNFNRLKNHLLPPLDQGLSALIEDLQQRGLLESTLVICLGEFGRTPKVNKEKGRDHWPDCFSVVLAGGGVPGGQIYGSSDKIGAYPNSDPVTPGDLAATMYWRFGFDCTKEIRDLTGRPYRLADGEPLQRLFA